MWKHYLHSKFLPSYHICRLLQQINSTCIKIKIRSYLFQFDFWNDFLAKLKNIFLRNVRIYKKEMLQNHFKKIFEDINLQNTMVIRYINNGIFDVDIGKGIMSNWITTVYRKDLLKSHHTVWFKLLIMLSYPDKTPGRTGPPNWKGQLVNWAMIILR